MLVGQHRRIAGLGDWVVAPESVTVPEASFLSGHDLDTVHFLIQDGAVDAELEGDTWLIEKLSLWEFQEALCEVLHWDD